MGGVREFNQHLVGTRGQSHQDDGFTAGVDEVPWSIINGDMNVPDARRNGQGALTEDRHYP